MADIPVSLTITAKDLTTAAFNGVKKGIEGISTATKTLQDAMGNLGRLMSAGAAFAGFKTIINAAADLEEATGKMGGIFKGVEEDAKSMAATLATGFGLSKAGATDALNNFGLLFQNMGYGAKTSLDLGGNLTKLAADMSAFANVPVANVLNDLQSAMNGSTRSLKQYGIAVDENILKEESARLGIADGVRALSLQEKAFVTYNVILKQTTTMQGEFARSTDSYQVQMAKAKAELSNTSATLGSIFLPKIVDVLKFLNQLPTAFKVIIVALPPLVAAFVALGGPLTAIVAAIGGIVYVAAKLNSAFNDSNQITMEYAKKLTDINKVQELMARVQEKIILAEEDHARKTKVLMQIGGERAAQAENDSIKEEARLKFIKIELQGKIDLFNKEKKAADDASNAALSKEAKEAAQREKNRLAAEQAIKDKAKAEDDARADAVKKEEDIQDYIKEAKSNSIADQYQREKMAIQIWYEEKLLLVKGNKEAEELLEKEHKVKLDELDQERLNKLVAQADKEVALIEETERLKVEAAQMTVTSFARNTAIVASEFKEMFGIAKAAAVAEATMAGAQSVLNSYKWGTAIGGPILGTIMGAMATVASGIQIAKIVATPPPFQTAIDQQRVVGGPSTREQLITAHGNEVVSRKGGGGLVINVAGSIYNADETLDQISRGLREYQKKTGFQLVPA